MDASAVSVEVKVENDVLNIEGHVDFSKYDGLQPLYTEYNVGHYARSFRLSSKNCPRRKRQKRAKPKCRLPSKVYARP